MFLLACMGISFKLKIFLSQAFLAAHCFKSSNGNVKIVMAKNTKNASFKKLPQLTMINVCTDWSFVIMVVVSVRVAERGSF